MISLYPSNDLVTLKMRSLEPEPSCSLRSNSSLGTYLVKTERLECRPSVLPVDISRGQSRLERDIFFFFLLQLNKEREVFICDSFN